MIVAHTITMSTAARWSALSPLSSTGWSSPSTPGPVHFDPVGLRRRLHAGNQWPSRSRIVSGSLFCRLDWDLDLPEPLGRGHHRTVVAEPARRAVFDPFALVLVERFVERRHGLTHLAIAHGTALEPEADEAPGGVVHDLDGRAVGIGPALLGRAVDELHGDLTLGSWRLDHPRRLERVDHRGGHLDLVLLDVVEQRDKHQ